MVLKLGLHLQDRAHTCSYTFSLHIQKHFCIVKLPFCNFSEESHSKNYMTLYIKLYILEVNVSAMKHFWGQISSGNHGICFAYYVHIFLQVHVHTCMYTLPIFITLSIVLFFPKKYFSVPTCTCTHVHVLATLIKNMFLWPFYIT